MHPFPILGTSLSSYGFSSFPHCPNSPSLACPPLRDVIASNFRSLQASQVVEDRVLVILSSNRGPCDAFLLRKKCEQHSKVWPKRNEKQVISQNSEIHCDQISLLTIGIGTSWVGRCTIYNCLTLWNLMKSLQQSLDDLAFCYKPRARSRLSVV